ncbi:ATP-binding cassette domain-containing protein [Phytohabitans kaempferiae]|uniref:ATP-binding cassette domain-containing protein n=1 Tax=Phytohabitans kaempferiae TaxID=1620943 RepID=A0ABV6MHM0_9ACTN
MAEPPLLNVRDLTVCYPARRRQRAVQALEEVSIHLAAGETLGVVGESGSGKSTLGNAILGLVRPTAGRIMFDGDDISHTPRRARRRLATRMQVVFQDPYSSLNPSRTIGHTLAEPLRVHRELSRAEAVARVVDVLDRVGLSNQAVDKYPAQFSGGQRQRIAIARALVLEPELVICDEPTSALDLSVQAQILNLLLELQHDLGLAYLFISHDIEVIRHMAHRVAVLLKGRLVEEGSTDQIAAAPAHPYTRTLLAAALPHTKSSVHSPERLDGGRDVGTLRVR